MNGALCMARLRNRPCPPVGDAYAISVIITTTQKVILILHFIQWMENQQTSCTPDHTLHPDKHGIHKIAHSQISYSECKQSVTMYTV